MNETITIKKETGEAQQVDPDTGGSKNTKPAAYHLIPPEIEHELALLFGVGATKYAPGNWAKGYNYSQSYSALRRHLAAWWTGDEIDQETGTNHLVNVIWHATVLVVNSRRVQQGALPERLDDRPNDIDLEELQNMVLGTSTLWT